MKVLANLTVRINGLVCRYVEDDMALTVRMAGLELCATDASYRSHGLFANPEGPWKLLHRVCRLSKFSVHLGRVSRRGGGGGSAEDVEEAKRRDTLLSELSVSVRVRAYMGVVGGSMFKAGTVLTAVFAVEYHLMVNCRFHSIFVFSTLI